IVGPSTGLLRPTGVAIDESRGELYVSNDYANSISIYDAAATGDAAPTRTITSSSYLTGPVGLALDLIHDEVVVASQGYNSVVTFKRLADEDSLPERVIFGLNLPQHIALDLVNDEILVANSSYQTPNAGAILVFRRTANSLIEAVTPIRRLEGNATKLCN